MLLFANGDTFAGSATRYYYAPATPNETTNRIILPIRLAGNIIEAVVDTGAPYVVIASPLARQAGFSSESVLSRETLLIRGMRLNGSVTRLTITLVATFGDDLDVDATVFVPDVEEYWGNFPSFIGLMGFLERIRFAVDPSTDIFYFGAWR